MHISDGILPEHLWIGGYALAGVGISFSLRRLDEGRIPRIAVLSSLFFVASSLSVRVGPGSLHLLLNGLVGVILGRDAVSAIALALLFQFLFLAHGGITTLGVNTVTMAGGALAASALFRLRRLSPNPSGRLAVALGFAASAVAILVSGALFFLVLRMAGQTFQNFSELCLALQLPLLAIEPPLTAVAVAFLLRVKPELLDGLGRRQQ